MHLDIPIIQSLVALLCAFLILILPRLLYYLLPNPGATGRLIPSLPNHVRSNLMSKHAQKPHKKMPERHSTDKQPMTKEEKIDAQAADSFPASDPPSYSGGNRSIGAPTGRES